MIDKNYKETKKVYKNKNVLFTKCPVFVYLALKSFKVLSEFHVVNE